MDSRKLCSYGDLLSESEEDKSEHRSHYALTPVRSPSRLSRTLAVPAYLLCILLVKLLKSMICLLDQLQNKPTSQKRLTEIPSSEKSFFMTIAGYPAPFYTRKELVDHLVVSNVLIDDEYAPILNYVHQPKVIIDAGAHIGCGAVFFANRFPDAKIFAIEPSSDNYFYLRKNAESYSNIHCIQAALWCRNEEVTIENPTAESWGFNFKSSNGFEDEKIPGITISALCKRYEIESIDILKIDIEGAERELFSEEKVSWLSKVKTIAIETHDRFLPGCRFSVLRALERYNFEEFKVEHNENSFFVSK